jgi:hypothetical protein
VVLVIFMLLGTVQIGSHYLKNCMLFTPFFFKNSSKGKAGSNIKICFSGNGIKKINFKVLPNFPEFPYLFNI